MNIIKYPVKIILRKQGDMAFFSQLDLVRIMERAMRRSGLPAYFTQGFTPRIKFSFANGLKLGVEGEQELTAYFTDPVTLDQIKTHLQPQLPQGLTIL